MATVNYERYGLTGNPFRDLVSENLEDLEVFTVFLDVDRTLASVQEEVFDKENKALIALLGGHGSGKTHRLLLAQAEAKKRGAFVAYLDVAPKSAATVTQIAHALLAAKPMGGFSRVFSPPPWYRELSGLVRAKPGTVSPPTAGKAIARALNDNAPSLLLLNDLHNLAHATEANSFGHVLQEVADALKPGVLVLFGSFPVYFATLSRNQTTFASRVNRALSLPSLSPEEAGLILAKKMLAKRVVEDLDPFYPFEKEAIGALNFAAYGNPRRLIELADRALEYAAEHRLNRIDLSVVTTATTQPVAPPEPPPDPLAGSRPAPAVPPRSAGREAGAASK